jgi:hypothetical protein
MHCNANVFFVALLLFYFYSFDFRRGVMNNEYKHWDIILNV